MYDSYSRPRWLWLSLGHYSNHLTAAASLTGAAAILVFAATGVGVVSHLLLGLVVAVYAVWAVSATAERTQQAAGDYPTTLDHLTDVAAGQTAPIVRCAAWMALLPAGRPVLV